MQHKQLFMTPLHIKFNNLVLHGYHCDMIVPNSVTLLVNSFSRNDSVNNERNNMIVRTLQFGNEGITPCGMLVFE